MPIRVGGQEKVDRWVWKYNKYELRRQEEQKYISLNDEEGQFSEIGLLLAG